MVRFAFFCAIMGLEGGPRLKVPVGSSVASASHCSSRLPSLSHSMTLAMPKGVGPRRGNMTSSFLSTHSPSLVLAPFFASMSHDVDRSPAAHCKAGSCTACLRGYRLVLSFCGRSYIGTLWCRWSCRLLGVVRTSACAICVGRGSPIRCSAPARASAVSEVGLVLNRARGRLCCT